eukprot:4842015-Pyramimonas_sp.AAC.1
MHPAARFEKGTATHPADIPYPPCSMCHSWTGSPGGARKRVPARPMMSAWMSVYLFAGLSASIKDTGLYSASLKKTMAHKGECVPWRSRPEIVCGQTTESVLWKNM